MKIKPHQPPKLQTTNGLGYASTMHSRVRGLPGALPSTDSPGRMLGETEKELIFSSSLIAKSHFPTLHVQIYPLADGGRHVVAGDAEVSPHVLAPHPMYLERVSGPDVHLSARIVSELQMYPDPGPGVPGVTCADGGCCGPGSCPRPLSATRSWVSAPPPRDRSASPCPDIIVTIIIALTSGSPHAPGR